MKQAIFLFTLLLVGTSFVTGCASRGPGGQGRGGPPGGGMNGRMDMPGGFVARPITLLFTSMDASNDGILDVGELSAGVATEWSRLVGDGSNSIGAILIADWASEALGSPDALPNRLSFDTDLNSQVSEAEFRIGIEREFNTLDKDKNGLLTRSEMVFELPEMRMNMGGPMGGGAGGPGGGGNRPPPR